MASVTFPEALGGNGQTYTDDADPNTGLDGLGYTIRFIPCLQQAVVMGLSAKNDAQAADGFVQQCQTLRQETATDRQAVAEDRAAVEQHLQDAQARIGTTQALIDARNTALAAQAGAEDAETGAVAAQASAEAARDAAVVSGHVYPDTSAGLTATSDGQYFKTVAANQAGFLTLWRNNAGVATEIETYPSLTGIAQALEQANRKQTRLARSLQRLGDHGQTLHSDFNLAAYGLGTPLYGGVQDAVEGEELWNSFERLSGTYALQHVADGSLKYVYVPPNVIAREYNPETGQYQAQDYGALRNELLWSTVFSNAVWIKSEATVTVGEIGSVIEGSPAYKITESAANTEHIVRQSVVVNSSTFVFTVIAKAAERQFIQLVSSIDGNVARVNFDLISESINSGGTAEGSFTRLSRGWYAVHFTAPCTSGTTYAMQTRVTDTLQGFPQSYLGDGTSGIYIAHAQLVEGTAPGPVIVTEGAPVTRAADNISRTLGAEFNRSAGTFYVEGVSGGSYPEMYLAVSDGTSSNRVRAWQNTDSIIAINITDSAGFNETLTFSATAGSLNKIAISYSGGVTTAAVNGVVKSTQGAPLLNNISLGRNEPFSGNYLNGSVGHFDYNPTASTATQLQELTTP